MRKYLLLLSIILAGYQLLSQNLKQKTQINNGVKEVFFYKKIKGQGKIKEGEYKKYFVNRHNPTILIQKGEYLGGKKTGIWTYYNFSGDTLFAINKSNDSIILANHYSNRLACRFKRSISIKGPAVVAQTTWATNYIYEVDEPVQSDKNSILKPFYLEGDIEFYNILFKLILNSISYYEPSNYYSPNFISNFDAVIAVSINENGIVDNVEIPFSSEPKLNRIKEDLINQNLIWIPASQNNKYVDYELMIPISCKSYENENQYRFEVNFLNKDWVSEQTPYCNIWPIPLPNMTEIYESKY